jgi:hypothetical protein
VNILSLQQIKRDFNRLKESTDIGSLQVLLKRNPEHLTDSELDLLLMEVPVKQLYPIHINEANERLRKARETNGHALLGVSTERLREILDELHGMRKECNDNEPAAIEKRSKRD